MDGRNTKRKKKEVDILVEPMSTRETVLVLVIILSQIVLIPLVIVTPLRVRVKPRQIPNRRVQPKPNPQLLQPKHRSLQQEQRRVDLVQQEQEVQYLNITKYGFKGKGEIRK